MATIVSYKTWSGGDGIGDPIVHLFECREDPVDVLSVFFENHEIYSYEGISTPVDTGFPNNAQGLIIQRLDDYPGEIISQNGLSVHSLDIKKIKGYDGSISRSPRLFEKTVVSHIKRHLASKCYYGYRGLEKFKPLIGKNYLLMRDTDIIGRMKKDEVKMTYYYPNGNMAQSHFVAAEWVKKQEQMLQKIFEIAKAITEVKRIEDMIPLYKKYQEEKSEIC